jgi:hypothetical protein
MYSAIIENKQTLHERFFPVKLLVTTPDLEMMNQFMTRRDHACADSGGEYFVDLL